MNVREALNEIVANYGLEILRESLRTSSMVADYANGRNMLADRRLTKRALELGVADYLLDYGCDEAQKRRVVQMMERDGFEKVSAVYVVESLISTISSINTRIQISDGTVDGDIGLAGKYIAFDLANGTEEKFTSAPAGGWGDKYKTTHLLMRRIPKGTFTMGSPENELGRRTDETAHQVTLTQDYYMGVFELTQAQYKLITGDSSQAEFDSGSEASMRPMETVSYNDIRGSFEGAHWPTNNQVDSFSMLGKLRAKFGNRLFDLPTEAQWEYACRAGTTTALNNGNNLTSTTGTDPEVDKVGWYSGSNTTNGETNGTKVVGRKLTNNWGLYDMHGNVLEWCLDWYVSSYGSGTVTDPKGQASGSYRALRGGGWYDVARYCRSATRSNRNPSGMNSNRGLRLVLPIVQSSVVSAHVDSVSPTKAVKGQPVEVTVKGTNLPSTLAFTFDHADSVTKINRSATSVTFRCTPTQAGSFSYTVKDKPAGQVLKTGPFTIVVPAGDYIAFDLANGTQENFSAVPAGGWGDKYKTTHLLMCRIPKGTFTMGSPESELGRVSWSGETAHQVTLTQDYYMGVFELTQAQYKLITRSSSQAEFDSGSNSLGKIKDKMRPMEQVSYNAIRGTSLGTNWPANNQVDSSSVLGKLRAKFGNRLFDLPTEAQWEYACRAGTTTALNSGKNLTSAEDIDPELDKVGWYDENNTTNGETYGTKVVGRKLPNNWGLYDMHGNVWEWCLDWWDGDSYGSSAVTDPKGATSGSYRFLRGGSWTDGARYCRSAFRGSIYPSLRGNNGFRLVLPIGQPAPHVDSVSPATAVKGQPVEVTVKGTNLPSTLAFTFDHADSVTKINSSATSVTFRCTPTQAGSFSYTVKDKPAGQVLRTGPFRIVVPAGDYIAFDLANGTEEKFTSAPAGGWGDKYKTTHLLMRRIPKGTFTMGSPINELGRNSNETAHQVTLTQDYYMGVFELTKAQYKLITRSSSQAEFDSGSNSLGKIKDKMRPMEQVSYNAIRGSSLGANWPTNSQVDSTSMLGKLRAKFGNRLFDLPTEAQWEYACRAGTTTALNSGKNLTSAEDTDPEMDKVGGVLE